MGRHAVSYNSSLANKTNIATILVQMCTYVHTCCKSAPPRVHALHGCTQCIVTKFTSKPQLVLSLLLNQLIFEHALDLQ